MSQYEKEFEQRVDRTGLSDVKGVFVPEEIRESGHLSMWGAEFEFPTAPFVIDAITEWAKNGLYCYTVDSPEFREQVRWWMRHHRNWEIEPDWIVPVYGITSSIATAMRAFTGEGDGIISFDPIYHMYWNAVERSGRRKVVSPLRFDGKQYTIDWENLRTLMRDPSNRMMLVCNPHNPLGKVFHADELRGIADLARENDVILFSDEIFAECLYEGVVMHSFPQIAGNDLKVITATSLGKWLSFTGTNQANLLIPDPAIREAFLAERDKEFYGSMNPMMLPAYRAAYTEQGEAWLREFMHYIEENYRMVDQFFRSEAPQFHAVRPEGTYILWVDARAFCPEEKRLQEFLIHRAHFHTDPGTTYGKAEGFFRMSLSLPREELRRNLESLGKAVSDYPVD